MITTQAESSGIHELESARAAGGAGSCPSILVVFKIASYSIVARKWELLKDIGLARLAICQSVSHWPPMASDHKSSMTGRTVFSRILIQLCCPTIRLV